MGTNSHPVAQISQDVESGLSLSWAAFARNVKIQGRQLQHSDSEIVLRSSKFDVIETLPFTEETLLPGIALNRNCLGRKAAMCLKLGSDPVGLPFLVLALNSYKAVDVLFDRLAQVTPILFFADYTAADILQKSYEDTHDRPIHEDDLRYGIPGRIHLPPMPVAPCKWEPVGSRKLIAAPYVRYAKAVIGGLGKQRIWWWMRGHIRDVEMAVGFLTDVLADVRENGLAGKDFEGLFEGVKIIAELKPPLDRELFERFAGLLQNPEVSARYEFPRREELVGLLLKCFEPDPE
jgi:hypothetical protein